MTQPITRGSLWLQYPSKVGGSILGNVETHNQMAFAPGSIAKRIVNSGLFDFDNAVFSSLRTKLAAQHTKAKAVREFRKHIRHHISDHRPPWVQLRID